MLSVLESVKQTKFLLKLGRYRTVSLFVDSKPEKKTHLMEFMNIFVLNDLFLLNNLKKKTNNILNSLCLIGEYVDNKYLFNKIFNI